MKDLDTKTVVKKQIYANGKQKHEIKAWQNHQKIGLQLTTIHDKNEQLTMNIENEKCIMKNEKFWINSIVSG